MNAVESMGESPEPQPTVWRRMQSGLGRVLDFVYDQVIDPTNLDAEMRREVNNQLLGRFAALSPQEQALRIESDRTDLDLLVRDDLDAANVDDATAMSGRVVPLLGVHQACDAASPNRPHRYRARRYC